MVAPLTQQLKKDVFLWNEEATGAFEALKNVMVTLPFVIGTVLTQK